MRRMILAAVTTLITMGLLDAIWLTTMTARLYRRQLADLLLDHPDLRPAIAFYLLYAVGVLILVVLPAREYGWTVIGAIQPADFAEPTPREVASLIDQVRALGVPAIFGSEVFTSPVLAQIAQESGARYVSDLRDDDLPGDPGDPEHSYLALMVFDLRTFMGALGGDVTPFDGFDTTNVSPATTATYR